LGSWPSPILPSIEPVAERVREGVRCRSVLTDRPPVAFITKLELGGVAFANDQRCKNPMRPTEAIDVYEYDPVGRTWFRCFDCDGKDLAGVLEKRGEDLDLSVADAPSTQVQG